MLKVVPAATSGLMFPCVLLVIICKIVDVYGTFSTNDNGYYVGISSTEHVSWNEALSYCQTQIGTSLASIHSDFDNNNAILSVAGTAFSPNDNIIRYAWIGFNDINNINDGVFKWSDGSDVTYTNWDINSGQGNNDNGNECCVHLSGLNELSWQGRWNNDECDTTYTNRYIYAFVCNHPDTQLFSSNNNGKYIGVSSNKHVTWYESLLYCQFNIGTSLASIHSDIDNNNAFLSVDGTSFAPNNNIVRYAWIGFNDINNNDGAFKWSDGSDVDYTNWDINSGQPNNLNGNQYCVQLSGLNEESWQGRWNDDQCDTTYTSLYTYAFVCNKPNTRSPNPTPNSTPNPTPRSIGRSSLNVNNYPTRSPSPNPTPTPTIQCCTPKDIRYVELCSQLFSTNECLDPLNHQRCIWDFDNCGVIMN